MSIQLAASLLAADFANLGTETTQVIDAGVDSIHFDVMDHHFVPNLSFGACVCASLRKAGIKAPIDVHLMVTHPHDYIEPFAKAGATLLTFHPETVPDVAATITQIKQAGMQAGLAFNPDQPVDISADILTQIDLILLMSVFPGFGGQSFIDSTFDKITTTRKLLKQHNSQAKLGIDGGVKTDNAAAITAAGADFLVIGSGLFAADNYKQKIAAFRAACL